MVWPNVLVQSVLAQVAIANILNIQAAIILSKSNNKYTRTPHNPSAQSSPLLLIWEGQTGNKDRCIILALRKRSVLYGNQIR